MSHHYSGPNVGFPRGDARLDLTDLFAFPKPGDAGRSILIVNFHPSSTVVSPEPTTSEPFAPEALYELKIDTDGDAVADIAYRVRFSSIKGGAQTATLRRIEGAQAAGTGDEGQVIVEAAPVSTDREAQVTKGGDYRFFAGWRSDPFFFDVQGALNNFQFTGNDFFADKNVCSIALEVPNAVLGRKKVGLWARTLVRAGGSWVQVDRGARPAQTVFLAGDGEDRNAYLAGEPAHDSRFVALFAHSLEHAGGYAPEDARRVAERLLPDILFYDPTRPASFPDNGRTFTDDVLDAFLAILTNGKVTGDKVGPHKDLIAEFPYLGSPHKAIVKSESKRAANIKTTFPVSFNTSQVAGTKIFYREAGDPEAPAVLLLHGFPTSSHMFRNLIPELADDYHVVAPDLPGFGFSDAPDRQSFQYTFDHLAEIIGDFVEQLGLKKFAVYIFDYGAPVGLRLALRFPDSISALITQNGNAYVEGLSDAWAPIRAYWENPTQANRNALKSLLTPESTRSQYTTGVNDADHRIAPEDIALDQAFLDRPRSAENQLDLFGDYKTNVALYPKFQEYFRTRRPPTLAVWGRNDPFFLPAGAEAFRRDNPAAKVVLYDTGHFALETHVSEIAEEMRAFLNGVYRQERRTAARNGAGESLLSRTRKLSEVRAPQAIGALALGAAAIGAWSLGAMAIGGLAIGRARIKRLEIDELVIRRLRGAEKLAGKMAEADAQHSNGTK